MESGIINFYSLSVAILACAFGVIFAPRMYIAAVSLFLLIWSISFCCYLSISLKFANCIFCKIYNLSDASQTIDIISILTFVIALLPHNYSISYFFETYIYRFITIGIIFLGICILLLSNYKKKKVGE